MLGLVDLAGLEIAQDHMELVHKLVVKGPQGVQGVLGAGQLVRQAEHLCLVVEDGEHAAALLALDGQLGGQHLAVAQGAGAVIAARVCPGRLPAAGVGEELGQGAARRVVLRLEQALGGPVAEDDGARRVGGHHAVFNGVEHVGLAEIQVQ